MAIFLYTGCIMAVSAVLYASCSVAAGAVLCAGYTMAVVKGFADACYKGEEGVVKGIIYHKDKEGEQRRKKVITSLIKVKLRRL
jgi:hypothetical protein